MKDEYDFSNSVKNPYSQLLSRWAEINADHIRRKTVIPADGGLRGGKLRRESTAYRPGTKSAINYVHLLK